MHFHIRRCRGLNSVCIGWINTRLLISACDKFCFAISLRLLTSMKMKAVILAAGKGTRMQHLTTAVPKPMLQIAGKPILEYIVQALVKNNVREIFIITGYRAEVVEQYFKTGEAFGVRIQYGRQIVQDGTGKAPELAIDFIGDSPFLLMYGDIIVPPTVYGELIRLFHTRGPHAVIAVTSGEDVQKGGLCIFSEGFQLTTIVEKPSESEMEELKNAGVIQPGGPLWYNAGIYVFTPILFTFTAKLQKSRRGEYELTDAIKNMVASGYQVLGVPIIGPWYDVRDPGVLQSLQEKPPEFMLSL